MYADHSNRMRVLTIWKDRSCRIVADGTGTAHRASHEIARIIG